MSVNRGMTRCRPLPRPRKLPPPIPGRGNASRRRISETGRTLARGFPAAAILGWFLAGVLPVLAEDVPQGQLVARVVCQADPAQSYAAYVPARYAPREAWPVLFCFDPAANGSRPVERFRLAAEKHGYIVVGSNNSRNGPVADNDAAADAMLRDASRRWSLDRRRVYAAGFSGGARFACQLGLAGVVRGVIASSGGFLGGAAMPERVPFDFFGAAGTDDFNREEMLDLDRDLESRNTAHRFRSFIGGHEWLPAAVADEALAWLDAQFRHAGIRDRYDAFIQTSLQEQLTAAGTLPPAEAYLEYRAMVADFKNQADLAAIKKRAALLARQPEVDDAARALEKRRAAALDAFFRLARNPRNPAWRTMIAGWREAAAAPGDSAERRLMRRVITGAAVRCSAAARSSLARGESPEQALVWAELASAVGPDQPLPAYNLACLQALAGNLPEALAALALAAQDGFNDDARAWHEPAFASLRGATAFQSTVVKMKNSPGPAGPRH